MVTEKRIGRVHSRRVRLCTPRGREHSLESNDIYFGTADDALLFCPNEHYIGFLFPEGKEGKGRGVVFIFYLF